MAELTEGAKAPDFALADQDGNRVRLSDIEAQYIVAFFYPKDDTPGCTIEAKGFTADLKKFQKLDAEVIGISGGSAESKAKFCEKHGLETQMLSDPDFAVSQKFGAYGDKNFMGKTSKGIVRKTFVLDSSRKVVKVFDKVKPEGHPEEVLAFIRRHREQAAA